MSSSNSLYLLVVLYKTSVDKADTLQSINACKSLLEDSQLLMWDNSPTPLPRDQQHWLNGLAGKVQYIHTPQNMPLSVLYNQAIGRITDARYLVILDQDSRFDESYIHAITAAGAAHPDINLMVPVIRHNQQIMSPGWFYRFKGAYRSRITFGVNDSRNMSVVSSGMVISVSWLQGQFEGFNERLTFYGIDTFFSVQYRLQNPYFLVLDCRFDHSLSVTEHEPYAVKKRRFDNHILSLAELTRRRNWLIRLAGWMYIQWEKIKFGWKYDKSAS